ncbi:DnaJ C-terminal domain-containing protein [Comamonas faecalis]|uniref:DnaJ C-terminal domain-containing protein n=1 Tax=Comamonas faecalis TaxID=1387849 RepID=A0ABP7QUU8_9BURK
MEYKDYYQILGVERNASADAIKKAYRKLARRYHPDVSKEPDAATRMAEVNEANTVLSDPEKRAAYDALGSAAAHQAGQDFRPPPHWDSGFEFTGAPGGGAGMDEAQFSDFFEQLFGHAARARQAQSGRGAGHAGHAGHGSQRGADHHAHIELDLRDSYRGGEHQITLRGARLDGDGRLVHEERQLRVTIPKGVRAGQLIRLAGHGSPGVGGAAAGDLFLEVQFKPDARWRAEERDVYQGVAVAPWEAELGGPIEVQTPDGATVEVNVPARWKSGRKLRLKGRGLPAATPGDLYLELHLALPAADTPVQQEAWRALAQAYPSYNPRHGG